MQRWQYNIMIRQLYAQLYHNAGGSGGLKEPCIKWGSR